MTLNKRFGYIITHYRSVVRSCDTLVLFLSVLYSIIGFVLASNSVCFNLLLFAILLISIGMMNVAILNLFNYENNIYPISYIFCVMGMKEFVHVLSSIFCSSKGYVLVLIIVVVEYAFGISFNNNLILFVLMIIVAIMMILAIKAIYKLYVNEGGLYVLYLFGKNKICKLCRG